MVKLIEQTPLHGLLPLTIGTVTLTEVVLDPMTMIAPFKGQMDAVNAVLQGGDGISFPAPGRMEIADDVRMIWAGQGRALLIGADAPAGLNGLAAMTDQADANACALIDGAGTVDVLARLVPMDLRLAQFPLGQTARTFVNHMMASVTRVNDTGFEVMVMRSMGQTLVHELTDAMQAVAARG